MKSPGFGLLTYPEDKSGFNLGDYIQGLAVRQFLPRVDKLIPRDAISEYRGPLMRLVCSGWFGPIQGGWTPSKDIIPLFISFHLSPRHANAALSSESKAYLSLHGPVGCRDEATVSLLRAHGIDAYFSGCLTLTLRSNSGIDGTRKGVFLVDPFVNDPFRKSIGGALRGVTRAASSGRLWAALRASLSLPGRLPSSLWKRAQSLSHQISCKHLTEEDKFDLAAARLNVYAKAETVITSRLHCALPCLAFGTPVIFINGYFEAGDTSRMQGLIDLLDRLDLQPNGTWNEPTSLLGPSATPKLQPRRDHEALSNALRIRVQTFVNERL